MSDQGSQDKQLPASARKLQKAREEGQVVRSKDLGHFLVILAATGVLMGLTPVWMDKMQTLLHAGLRFDARMVANEGVMLDRLSQWATEALMIVVPFSLSIALASAAASVMAGGWVMSFKIVYPNFGKLNPIAGFGNLFSKQQMIDALKASALGLILGAAGATFLYKAWPGLMGLLSQPLPAAIHDLGVTLGEVLGSMLLVIAAFAIIDWPLQKFLFAEKMKMSHQDMKDEFKQQEGNTEVKGKIKQKMREMARKRMLAAIPTADLVVMNPTHYAVALKYDEATMGAPRVVAKGLDLLALKIRDLAVENRVPVLEAPPLARALYANTEVDQEVPVALYSAVAQVLAYVFQLRNALAGRSPLPGNLPDLDVPAELDPQHAASMKAKVEQEEPEFDV
ncbi:MAG TPA: flagellar biosynthesis protein FlhB [Aquabacterium sp.]|uniref:flagellar biosynthesis protein FlhB n=1 Tax=Aquabacterium sp. TaxID=1872578 RepID=UPI002E30FBFB|nr:flagellar biosynthesis protein FlhB [Aquabacterium sp.]HEX5354610.1 flagellar biosynthesis protein FlhB [Aquabacterium sp.]